jgi:hypothetical protein
MNHEVITVNFTSLVAIDVLLNIMYVFSVSFFLLFILLLPHQAKWLSFFLQAVYPTLVVVLVAMKKTSAEIYELSTTHIGNSDRGTVTQK